MYIINFAEIVYHQNEVLYIIKSQRNTPSVVIFTLKRDDIRLAAMIYQVCDLDKKILQKRYPFLQYVLVEVVRVELTSYSAAKKLSTYLVYLLFLNFATRVNTLCETQKAEYSLQNTFRF